MDYFGLRYEVRIEFSFFQDGFPVVPEQFVEKTVLSLYSYHSTFVNNKLTICLPILNYYWAVCLGPLLYMSIRRPANSVLITVSVSLK